MAVPLTRVLLRRKISVNSMDALFHIDWTWMMHAQERKDFQRVQQARDIWKRRAVVRGEDRRRSRERRQEVERSRAAWRDRALAAAHRTRQLAMEPHQLKSALTQAPQPTTIHKTHFFSALCLSISCCTVPSRSARLAKFSGHCCWLVRR